MELENKQEIIRKLVEDYATAKSERIYLEQYRKIKKSVLMKDAEIAGVNTAAKQERDALAHEDYLQVVTGLSHAVARETELYWALKMEEWKFEGWRTEQANHRAERQRYG